MLELNKKKLIDIQKNNPGATHVYIRRFKNGKDIGVTDIPVSHALFTITNHPDWEIVSSNKQMDEDVERLFMDDMKNDSGPEPEDIVEVPARPSEMAAETKRDAKSTKHTRGRKS